MCNYDNLPHPDADATADADADAAYASATDDSSSDPDYDPSDEETETETAEDNTENYMPIRSKWNLDGATSLDDCIRMYKELIEYFENLKKDGWEIVEPVADDYGWMKRVVTLPQNEDATPQA